jgi:hypothetical protein
MYFRNPNKKDRVESLVSTLGFHRAYDVGSDGRSGGLGVFWHN